MRGNGSRTWPVHRAVGPVPTLCTTPPGTDPTPRITGMYGGKLGHFVVRCVKFALERNTSLTQVFPPMVWSRLRCVPLQSRPPHHVFRFWCARTCQKGIAHVGDDPHRFVYKHDLRIVSAPCLNYALLAPPATLTQTAYIVKQHRTPCRTNWNGTNVTYGSPEVVYANKGEFVVLKKIPPKEACCKPYCAEYDLAVYPSRKCKKRQPVCARCAVCVCVCVCVRVCVVFVCARVGRRAGAFAAFCGTGG